MLRWRMKDEMKKNGKKEKKIAKKKNHDLGFWDK